MDIAENPTHRELRHSVRGDEPTLGARRLREARVQCRQRCIERLSERNVPSIVNRDVMPKLPDSLGEGLESMKLHVEILEVLESTVRLLLGNSLTSLEPANYIGRFDRKVLRRE